MRVQLFSELRWIYHGAQISRQCVPYGGIGVWERTFNFLGKSLSTLTAVVPPSLPKVTTLPNAVASTRHWKAMRGQAIQS